MTPQTSFVSSRKMSATPHRRLQDLSVKASRCEGSFPRQTNFADGQRSFICAACIFEPYAKYNISPAGLAEVHRVEHGSHRLTAGRGWRLEARIRPLRLQRSPSRS